jgi:hypothetical protein
MIFSPALPLALAAGVAGAALGATVRAAAAQGSGVSGNQPDVVLWIASALLGLVTLLIAGAWNDLRRRDREVREQFMREQDARVRETDTAHRERARMFAILDGHGRDIAVLLDRHDRYTPSVSDVGPLKGTP